MSHQESIPGGQPLSTINLELPFMGQYPLMPNRDARVNHAQPVAELLVKLHTQGIDRTEAPVIATYAGVRVNTDTPFLYEDNYARAVGRGIWELTQEAGLNVVVKKGLSTIRGEDPADVARRAAMAARHRSSGFLSKMFKGSSQPVGLSEVPDPDFCLDIALNLDLKSEGPDRGKDTWSYKRVITAISILASKEKEG